MKGRVVHWNERNYGFIKRDDGRPDLFVHARNVVGELALPVGAPVEFDDGEDPRTGRPCATNVKVLR